MSVRIYKDNLRQPIYRTLLLTDMVIFGLIAFGIAAFTYLLFLIVFGHIIWMEYLFMLGLLEPTFLIIATLQIDNQAIYKILARGMVFLFVPKKFRGNQLGGYYNDFTIQDDLLMRKKSICKVFRINPYDISALNENERNTFFANLKQVLHILPTQLQIIVQKEVATVKDFTDHFLHIYQTLPKHNPTKEEMVANYQRELSLFVESEQLLKIAQYGVFSVEADTSNVSEKILAIGKLEDMYKRIASAFETCHIETKPLTNTELSEYMGRLLR